MVRSFTGVARLRTRAAGENSGLLVGIAEGATAPETLRQKDRGGGWTLWKAGDRNVVPPKG